MPLPTAPHHPRPYGLPALLPAFPTEVDAYEGRSIGHVRDKSAPTVLGHGCALGRAACDAGIEGENAAAVTWRWWRPTCAALGQHTVHLVLGESLALHAHDRQPALGHVNLDQVVLLNQSDGAAIQGFGGDMPDAWALHRSREASVGNDGGGGIERGIGCDDRRGEVHLGHAVGTRSLVANHYHVARRHLTIPQRIKGCLLIVEDPRRSYMGVHLFGDREGLDHGSTGSQVAAQHGDTTIGPKGFRARANYLAPRRLDVVQVADPLGEEAAVLDLLQVFSQHLACDGEAVQMEHIAEHQHNGRLHHYDP